MKLYERKVLTIISEASIEEQLTDELTTLGARGYTISDVRGRGDRGERSAVWEASRNVRIEVVCDEEIAMKIATRLFDKYCADYGIVLHICDAHVLRDKKF